MEVLYNPVRAALPLALSCETHLAGNGGLFHDIARLWIVGDEINKIDPVLGRHDLVGPTDILWRFTNGLTKAGFHSCMVVNDNLFVK